MRTKFFKKKKKELTFNTYAAYLKRIIFLQ